jgi:HK97 family phage portal protein
MYITGSNLQIYDTNIPGPLGPQTINEYAVLSIPAYWRGVNFLSENLATFPRAVHLDSKALDVPHRLDPILKIRPNQLQNSTNFWRTFFFHAVHLHNAYGWIRRKSIASNAIAGIYNLMPGDVTPFRWCEGAVDDDWELRLEQFYYIHSRKTVIAAADMIHVTGLSYDGMAGLNPILIHKSTFERGRAQDQYMTRFLMRGTMMRGAIQIPAGASKDQVDSVIKTIRDQFVGPNAERDVIVLSDGATLNNATLNPQQSQLIEQVKYTSVQIAQLLGVPPQFLYDLSDSRYNNSIEMAGDDVVRYSFRPWILLAQDELDNKLLSDQERIAGYGIRLDPSVLQLGDSKSISDQTIAQVQGGVRTRNEGRKVLGLPPNPDPESDKLKSAGDTTPPKPGATPATVPVKSSAHFAVIKPLLDDAAGRIESKTAKAFDRKGNKPETVWANVFAEEQAGYVRELFTGLAVAAETLAGRKIDVEQLATRYAAAIRKRAADGTVATLPQLCENFFNPGET